VPLLLLLRPLTATGPHDTKPCNSTIFQRKGRKRSKGTMTQNLSRRIAGLVRPAIRSPLLLCPLLQRLPQRTKHLPTA
jgi:hypothetical protein